MAIWDSNNDQETIKNPTELWISWSPSRAEFFYYDKNLKENIFIGPKIKFIILDILKTVTGYSKEYQKGIYANEVHDTLNQKMRVSIMGEQPVLIAEGIYSAIKDKVKAAGGKYTQSVYVALLDNDNFKLANIKINGINNMKEDPKTGQSSSSWVTLKNKYQGYIIETNKGFPVKIAGNFCHECNFKYSEEQPENVRAQAKKFGMEKLKPYLSQYSDKNVKNETLPIIEVEGTHFTNEDDITEELQFTPTPF